MSHKFCLVLSTALLLAARSAAESTVIAVQTQRRGETTYFHARLQAPPDLGQWDGLAAHLADRRGLSLLPRLVPQDGHTAAVSFELSWPLGGRGVRHLDFVGQVREEGVASLRLLYPTDKVAAWPDKTPRLAPPPLAWGEAEVRLDLGTADVVAPPTTRPRPGLRVAVPDDLQGRWALARAQEFAILEQQTPELGFYNLAREATCRKHEVQVPPMKRSLGAPEREQEHRRLYEMTTGATALTESLALRRLLGSGPEDRAGRTIDIAGVQGIDIAQHPWEAMMGDKKPAPEPLARLIPHDNYYVAFRQLTKFLEFTELLDRWGTNVMRAYEFTSRDYRLKERYEQQLCLRSTVLGKTLGPLIIKAIAVTGNDPYVREGSDMAVLFQVVNREAFLAAVEPFLAEARKKFGERLRESQDDHDGIRVESFVTPQREVSLHRAAFDDFVVYANSPVGLHRILDTHQGKGKCLSDSLDFRYMRTVFRADDREEDGFAFLSDAFIRNLVGPASKIKEKRRLEALTSLRLVTHGALFASLETGRLPRDHDELLRQARLKPEEIYAPEGKSLAWDGSRREAVSDAYGTLGFGTPLIELPIDRVTPREAADYRAFRTEYTQLWRRYFDPVGMRVSLGPKEVRLDTYVLPLIRSSRYNEMREITGNGTTTLDLSAIPPRTLFQFLMHLAPGRRWLFDSREIPSLGDWGFVRWEDSPLYWRMAELWVRRELGLLTEWDWLCQEVGLFCRLPFIVGFKIGDQRALDQSLASLENRLDEWNVRTEKETFRYKGVSLRRLRLGPDNSLLDLFNDPKTPKEQWFRPEFVHTQVNGAWYGSFSRETLRDQIDRVLARREAKEQEGKSGPEVNSSMYLAPQAAFSADAAVQAYLEWESHRRALANGPLWEALYRSGVLSPDAKPASMAETAWRTFGFVPVSPDGAAYRYDGRREEVVNERHGSLAQPTLQPRLDVNAPLARLLRQVQTLRADLRFREDGVHTTLTIRRDEDR